MSIVVGSRLEVLLYTQLPPILRDTCTREYVFAPPRRWRFDFAWVADKVAAEIEGGTWVQGAHGRGRHFQSDVDKYNAATALGWRVYRFTGDMVTDGRADAFLREILGERKVESE